MPVSDTKAIYQSQILVLKLMNWFSPLDFVAGISSLSMQE